MPDMISTSAITTEMHAKAVNLITDHAPFMVEDRMVLTVRFLMVPSSLLFFFARTNDTETGGNENHPSVSLSFDANLIKLLKDY